MKTFKKKDLKSNVESSDSSVNQTSEILNTQIADGQIDVLGNEIHQIRLSKPNKMFNGINAENTNKKILASTINTTTGKFSSNFFENLNGVSICRINPAFRIHLYAG